MWQSEQQGLRRKGSMPAFLIFCIHPSVALHESRGPMPWRYPGQRSQEAEVSSAQAPSWLDTTSSLSHMETSDTQTRAGFSQNGPKQAPHPPKGASIDSKRVRTKNKQESAVLNQRRGKGNGDCRAGELISMIQQFLPPAAPFSSHTLF